MKFTLSWLRTHLDTAGAPSTPSPPASPTSAWSLKASTDPGAALAPFRVAHVISAVQHPNADRLRACMVDAGQGTVSASYAAPPTPAPA